MSGELQTASGAGAYDKLKQRFSQIANLHGASAILQYDTYAFMAPGSEDDRMAQLLALESAAHHFLTLPDTGAWLDAAEAEAASLPAGDRRNLSLMRREWVHAAGLSPALAQEKARVETEGAMLHQKNMKSGDWGTMRDWYVHAFDVMRQVAQAQQAQLGTPTAYDALLDTFSPGLRDAALAGPFGAVEKALPALIREAVAKQQAQPAPLPLPHTTRAQQEELCRRVAKAMNFDFNRGRFDIVDVHPSSSGSPDDTRYTVQYKEEDFLNAVFTVLHENGHANYTQGLPKEWRYQPAGNDLGMAIHETMSRIMEQHAGRTPEFLQYLEREARDVLGLPDDPALGAENMRRILLRVSPSFIRIEADELTYPAHILLRHRLEKAGVEGTIDIADLPRHWNDGMEQLLGVRPDNPSEGCMQDCHWPYGAIGYFPAYSLGDMGAAQLFDAACKARPELRAELGKGNFTPLTEWLTENVYSKGALLTPDELFIAATGETLNPRFYLDHLSTRYLGRPWQEAPAPAAHGPAPAP